MAKQRDYSHPIYKSRWHQLVLDQPSPTAPPPLSAFCAGKPNEPITNHMEYWNGPARNHSNQCVENSYRPPPGQGIDLSREPRPVPIRENTLPWKYSKYYEKKDYPEG